MWGRAFFCLAFSLFPVSKPATADVIDAFAQSITKLYKVSMMCKDTLEPSTESYARTLGDYLRIDHSGAYYWALPRVDKRMDSEESCIYWMRGQLAEYRGASEGFRVSYPHYPSPPVLAELKIQNEDGDAPRRTIRRRQDSGNFYTQF